jgi:hypothetical protein
VSGTTGTYDAWKFDSANFPDPTAGTIGTPRRDGDFYWTELYQTAVGGFTTPPHQTEAPTTPMAPLYAVNDGSQTLTLHDYSELLELLWTQAAAEWT